MHTKAIKGLFWFLGIFFIVGCATTGINLYQTSDDVALGKNFKSEVEANPKEYPVVPRKGNEKAYQYLERVRDKILASGEVPNANVFSWEVAIIKSESVNAFCVPGGYIYFYTGIFDKLHNEAELAGVMAHEIAHAAVRHSTQRLTKEYGVSMVASLVLGQNSSAIGKAVADMAQGLGALAFSRADESQADEYAVRFMAKTDYEVTALADFFDVLESMQTASGQPQQLPFLSTHPAPANRKQNIVKLKQTYVGAKQGQYYKEQYKNFVALIK